MNKLKENKGITLIALVITIIVLLILAGITIALITGQDSAPDKAVEARTENRIGAAKDEAVMLTAKYVQEYYEKRYVQNVPIRTSSVFEEKIEVKGDTEKYSRSGIELPKLLANAEPETIPATVGEYVIEQFRTRNEGDFKYTIDENNNLVISDRTTNEELVRGSIGTDGVLSWTENNNNDGSIVEQETVSRINEYSSSYWDSRTERWLNPGGEYTYETYINSNGYLDYDFVMDMIDWNAYDDSPLTEADADNEDGGRGSGYYLSYSFDEVKNMTMYTRFSMGMEKWNINSAGWGTFI